MKPVLRLSPLLLSLVLVCSAIGGLVLTGLVVLTVLPLLVGLGLLAVWVVVVLLLGWAGIEALAALERWLESSPRLRR
ncbi:MAG: glypican [Synechococcaceae cyanobacterium]|nr:glypican [Synechococcaceae cyanobacterium]